MVNKDENTLKCTPCAGDICPADSGGNDVNPNIFTVWNRDDINDSQKLINDSQKLLDALQLANSMHDLINDEWVNAYCLVSELGIQIQYFPYFILLMAVCLCLVQKVSNT